MNLRSLFLISLISPVSLFAGKHPPCSATMTPVMTSTTVHIQDVAAVDNGCIEVPNNYGTFTIMFVWDSNHKGKDWSVDFGTPYPCAQGGHFSDSGQSTCTVTNPQQATQGTCQSDPEGAVCFEYTVTAHDSQGHKHTNDPQVIVDSSRGKAAGNQH